jgi:hypothetical protein
MCDHCNEMTPRRDHGVRSAVLVSTMFVKTKSVRVFYLCRSLPYFLEYASKADLESSLYSERYQVMFHHYSVDLPSMRPSIQD